MGRKSLIAILFFCAVAAMQDDPGTRHDAQQSKQEKQEKQEDLIAKSDSEKSDKKWTKVYTVSNFTGGFMSAIPADLHRGNTGNAFVFSSIKSGKDYFAYEFATGDPDKIYKLQQKMKKSWNYNSIRCEAKHGMAVKIFKKHRSGGEVIARVKLQHITYGFDEICEGYMLMKYIKKNSLFLDKEQQSEWGF